MKTICTFFFFLQFMNLSAQIIVSGKLVDAESKQHISFATVAFQSLTVSDGLEGVYTMEDGSFKVQLAADRYSVTVQMVGYSNYVIEQLEVVKDRNLGVLQLSPEVKQLEEVVVKGERSYIQNDLGKKTLFIGSDFANSGNSAINALESLPSVSTTIDGNINVRGSENIIIYVNGRETKRDPKSLRFISADALTKIELITNPSAKYDAEGVAGIINLVYAKSRSAKLDAFVSQSVPFRNSYGVNGSTSSDKFTFFFNANEYRSRFETSDIQQRQTPGDSLAGYINEVISDGKGLTRGITAGLTYEPDTIFSVSFEANYLKWDDKADQDQMGTFSFRNGRQENVLLRNDQLEVEDELTLTLSAEKKLGVDGNLKLQMTTGGEDEINRTNYNLGNEDISNTPIGQSIRQSDETEDQRYYQAKLDFSKTVSRDINLEVGVVSDFFSYNIDQSIGFFESIPIDNRFQVLLNKHASYVLLENKRNRFEYGLGLRYEHFQSESLQKVTDSTFNQRFDNLFPNMQWKYSLGRPDHIIGFNFTRRINRPTFFEVSPFLSYTDPLNLETGNPQLKPELAYLYELTYSNTIGAMALDLTAFRRSTRNVIQRFSSQFNENQLLVSYENLGARNDDGLEWSLSLDASDKIKIDASGSGYRTRFEEVNQIIFYQGRWNWQVRFNGRFRLEKEWSIDITQYYRAPRFSVQSKSIAQNYFNASVQKTFAEKKGTITLSFRDVFNNRVFGSEIVGENFLLTSNYKFQTQRLSLSIRYRII
ncbi:MAG: TonB-dependent receptor [Cyclobacteriaceae bacterium]